MMTPGIGRHKSDRRIKIGQGAFPFFLLDPHPASVLISLRVLGVGRNLAAEILNPLFQRNHVIDLDPAPKCAILGRDIRKAIAEPFDFEDSFSSAGNLPLPIAEHGSRLGQHNFRPDIEIRAAETPAGWSPARRAP